MCLCVAWKGNIKITAYFFLQTWTQLNHMNVTLSYSAILKRVNEISKQHTKVMDEWLREGAFVKFVGDNVDKQCNVRDIRSDHHGELRHMFSLLAIKARISPPAPLPQSSHHLASCHII